MAEQLKIRLEPSGDFSVASSPLRAHTLSEELERLGHSVDIGEGEGPYDIYVFQKCMPVEFLKRALREGATTVFDLDDDYLLEDADTRPEIIAFMNLVGTVTVSSRHLYDSAVMLHDSVCLIENPVCEEVVRCWLEDVHQAEGKPQSAPSALRTVPALDMDVVILALEEPGLVESTLSTVLPYLATDQATTIVSASRIPEDITSQSGSVTIHDEVEDFFEVYECLAHVLNTTPRQVLFLRAGCEVQKGFWQRLAPGAPHDTFVLPSTQQFLPHGRQNPTPPTRLDQLIQRPIDPVVAFLPASSQRNINPGFLNYQLWEYFLRSLADRKFKVEGINEPLILDHQSTDRRNPIRGYFDWVERHKPHIFAELPSQKEEWFRLKKILHNSVVETLPDLFSENLGALLSQYEENLSRGEKTEKYEQLEQNLQTRKEKYEESVEAYARLKGKHEETLNAYARLKEKHNETVDAYTRRKEKHEETLNAYARLKEKHNETVDAYTRRKEKHEETLNAYARLKEKHNETVDAYTRRKEKHEETLNAYARQKEKLQETLNAYARLKEK